MLAPWELGDFGLKPHLQPSVQTVFIVRRERGSGKRRSREKGCKALYVQRSTVYQIRQVMVRCVSSG